MYPWRWILIFFILISSKAGFALDERNARKILAEADALYQRGECREAVVVYINVGLE